VIELTARAQGIADWEHKELWENPYEVGTMDYFNWKYAWMEMEMKSLKEVLGENRCNTVR
jgi:hypothetical protein